MTQQTFIIVGASLAGAKAAEELREHGFEGRVVLIGSEPERPYERPPLTKDYLRGESEREQTFVHDPGFYDEHQIELMSGVTATAIDAAHSKVTLESGDELEYDRLLVTTGAEPRRINVPGARLDGIHYLRTLDDSTCCASGSTPGGRVAVVGAGWIGSEFAASARQRGLEVALIDPLELPNAGVFGDRGRLVLSRRTRAARRRASARRRGRRVCRRRLGRRRSRPAGGKTVECDFARGRNRRRPARRSRHAKPASRSTTASSSTSDLRSSAPNIFAAGDVANAWHPFFEQRIRVEHWANALNQGPAAARSMLGDEAAYDRLPYFFSDQYDVGMEYSGYARDWDRVVFRGDRDSGEFIAFWLRRGARRRGDERQRLGCQRARPGTDPLASSRSRLPRSPTPTRR